MGYIYCPTPPAYSMVGVLACSEAYEFGQLGHRVDSVIEPLRSKIMH